MMAWTMKSFFIFVFSITLLLGIITFISVDELSFEDVFEFYPLYLFVLMIMVIHLLPNLLIHLFKKYANKISKPIYILCLIALVYFLIYINIG